MIEALLDCVRDEPPEHHPDDAWAFDQDTVRPFVQCAMAVLDARPWRARIAVIDDRFLANDMALTLAVEMYGFLRSCALPSDAASFWSDHFHDWLCRGWGHAPGRMRLPRYNGIPYCPECGCGIREEARGPR